MDESEQTRHIEDLEKEVADLKNALEASRQQAESLSNKVEGNFTLTDHEIAWLKEAIQKLAETESAFEEYVKDAIKHQVESVTQVEATAHAALEGVIAKQEQDLAATRNALQRSFEENTDAAIGKLTDTLKGKIPGL